MATYTDTERYLMQLELFQLKESLIADGVECYTCNSCKQHKPHYAYSPSALSFLRKEKGKSHGGGGAIWCKECQSTYSKGKYLAEKNAPPKPKQAAPCDCCGEIKEPSKLHLDHDHITLAFRGWVCRNCNTGLGSLGDTVEGLEKALAYLKKVTHD